MFQNFHTPNFNNTPTPPAISVCKDYVTEKFWRVGRLVVPVVLQKSNYINIAPEKSYIAADDFESVKSLADHLIYLSGNTTAYLEYFEWTKSYWAPNFGFPAKNPYCELCKILHNKSRDGQSYTNMRRWYKEMNNCHTDFVDNLLERQSWLF